MNSPALIVAADALASDLRDVYARTLDDLDGVFGFGADAEAANVRATLPLIEQWETTLRDQAEAGRKPTGSPYSWEEWRLHGDALRRSLAYYAGISGQDDLWSGFKAVITETAGTLAAAGAAVADVANIGSWATSTKLLAGLALAALVVVRLK